MVKIDKRIKKDIKRIIEILRNKFKDNLIALILYGSWIKNKARQDSDIDILVIFKNKRKNISRRLFDLTEKIYSKREISLISASVKEFERETLPLFTAVKKEGRVAYGKVDLSLNPQPPHIKYKEFFARSKEFEKGKIETAQYLMKKGLTSGISEFCYIASKHAIQAGLAMRGAGFSSKFYVLVNWTEDYFGKELANVFKILFRLYVKSEYKIQDLTKEESLMAIKETKKILNKIYR